MKMLKKFKKLKLNISIQKFPTFFKISQQRNAFRYGCLIEFPRSNVEYKTVRTANILRTVYRIINVKMHLHHSH